MPPWLPPLPLELSRQLLPMMAAPQRGHNGFEMCSSRMPARDAVIAALSAAEVPSELASGLVGILVEAGYDLLLEAPSKRDLLERDVLIEDAVPRLLTEMLALSEEASHMRRQMFWVQARKAVKEYLNGKTHDEL